MDKTFVVNVAGHIIVTADEEEQAIEIVRRKLTEPSVVKLIGASSGFRVENATQIQLQKK